MSEAHERFQGFIDLQKTLPENNLGTISGTEIWLPGVSDADPLPHYVLFVRATEHNLNVLMATCAQRLKQINWGLESLKRKESFVRMGSEEEASTSRFINDLCVR